MSPTIRVDEEVYGQIKGEAEPFVDTPNTVLRRKYGLPNGAEPNASEGLADEPAAAEPRASATRAKPKRSRGKKRGRNRAVRGTLVPQAAYELPILKALVAKGGQAPSREVIDAIEPLLADKLKDVDRSETSSGEIRWRNRAQFVRLDLIEKGELVKDSPRGVWEITDAGRKRAEG